MKIYFAGTEGKKNVKMLKKIGCKHFLTSFYHLSKWRFEKEDDVMLDSGGFSARIRGVEINIKDYVDFINNNNVKLAINLDTNNVQETLNNQKILEAGTDAYIMPVYHLSDYKDEKYKNLIDSFINYPYICVGGMAGGRNKKSHIKTFLDFVFSKTQDKVKVHGLGLTGRYFMDTYPLYSVDSTSWLQFARYGSTYRVKGKQKIFLNPPDNPEELFPSPILNLSNKLIRFLMLFLLYQIQVGLHYFMTTVLVSQQVQREHQSLELCLCQDHRRLQER